MSETIAQSSSENYNKPVGTSAVVLAKGGGTRHTGSGLITVGGSIDMPRHITVHNNHGSQTLYLGWGSDVSTSNGLPVPAGEYRTLRAWYDDELWAVASGADTDTRVYVLHGKGAFSPLDLSPAFWVDASDESTIVESSGSVSEWQDKSGKGRDLTQSIGAQQPTTGTRTLNGLNVLDFDSDTMQATYGTSISQPLTIFGIAQNDDPTAISYLWAGDSLARNSGLFFLGNVGRHRINSGADLQWFVAPDGNVNLYRATYNGTATSFAINGDVKITGDAGTDSPTGLTVGTDPEKNYPFNGVVGELIVVGGALTAGQISDTETYLADKWGITLS